MTNGFGGARSSAGGAAGEGALLVAISDVAAGACTRNGDGGIGNTRAAASPEGSGVASDAI